MAVAIMGGLLVATLLTLFFEPALYSLLYRVKRPATSSSASAVVAAGPVPVAARILALGGARLIGFPQMTGILLLHRHVAGPHVPLLLLRDYSARGIDKYVVAVPVLA